MSDSVYIVPPCHEDVKILHQDEDILLVHKPHLLLSVPGRDPRNHDSIISRLVKEHPEAAMCHRLDLDTSGIMVVPLNKPALSDLNRQFRERVVEKMYTAVVYGIVEEDEGKIDFPIGSDWDERPRQRIDFENGKPAETSYTVVERDTVNNRTRLILRPVTGRTHQLRVHTKALGHPILGCDMYAHSEAFNMSKRMLLHATELSFFHPVTGERIEGVCPPTF